jgi:hypothetical protein
MAVGTWPSIVSTSSPRTAPRTPFGAETRRRLAEAHTHLAEEAQNPTAQRENAHKALLVLDALDDNAPAQDSREKRERLIIRARASSLAGDALAALRAVDLAASYSAYGDRDPDLMDLRSDALERAGQKRDAVTSWLWTAQQLTGPKRIEALRRAAACANSCNAHLTAIAAYKTAAAEGFGVASPTSTTAR